jgi:hypothetical protein
MEKRRETMRIEIEEALGENLAKHQQGPSPDAIPVNTSSLHVDFEIDVSDWTPGCEKTRDRCEEELTEWFKSLSLKTQLAIYYAQRLREFAHAHFFISSQDGKRTQVSPTDTHNFFAEHCPWITMVHQAENRIFTKNTKHFYKQPESGFNLFLITTLLRATEK